MTTIRPAITQDINDIASIWYKGWIDGHKGLVPDELYQYRTFESFLPRVTERISNTIISFSESNEITGFVMVRYNELEQIFIRRATRGSGLASELIEAGENLLHSKGNNEIYLVVVQGNDRAIKFYKKSGWVLKGLVNYMAQIPDGEFPLKCVKFTKTLETVC